MIFPTQEGIKMVNPSEMNQTETVKMYVDNFLSTGAKAKTIRTIWYQIKHNLQSLQGEKTEALFSKSMNKLIGKHLWNKYKAGSTALYHSLGIATKAIHYGSQPVILFCEKDLGLYDFINRELSSFTYLSSGQVPSYEVALLAEELEDFEDVYLVTANDFDKAGGEISASLVDRLSEAFRSLGSTCTIHHLPVEVKDVMTKYPTYTQSNGELGVELDAIPAKVLKKGVIEALSSVPRELFQALAFERWRTNECGTRNKEDIIIQELRAELDARYLAIRAEVSLIPLAYDDMFEFDISGRLIKQVTKK